MSYTPTLRHLGIGQLLVDAGSLEWGHVEALADGLVIDRRPLVVRLVDQDHYRVLQGKDRFIAAVIRGDREIACRVEL